MTQINRAVRFVTSRAPVLHLPVDASWLRAAVVRSTCADFAGTTLPRLPTFPVAKGRQLWQSAVEFAGTAHFTQVSQLATGGRENEEADSSGVGTHFLVLR